MNPFTFVYIELLFRPLFNLLVGITNLLPAHDVGLAIILVTLIVRLVLLPPSLHQARQARHNQEKMKDVQEKIKEVKKKHQGDKAKEAEATMQLYREAGVNPVAGCLPLLIQLPILIALYRVFLVGLSPDTFDNLYNFVGQPDNIKTIFLGISLTDPSLLLGVIAGAAQFVLMRMTGAAAPQPGGNEETAQMMQSMQRNMAYFFPVMTVFIALQLPAALALYWVASTVFAVLQQYAFKRFLKSDTNLPAI